MGRSRVKGACIQEGVVRAFGKKGDCPPKTQKAKGTVPFFSERSKLTKGRASPRGAGVRPRRRPRYWRRRASRGAKAGGCRPAITRRLTPLGSPAGDGGAMVTNVPSLRHVGSHRRG